MKKTVILYICIISVICLLSLSIHIPLRYFYPIEFSRGLHVVLESLISVLIFLIFLTARKLHSKTQDDRFLIISGGFLLGLILNVIHVFTANSFPFDSLSFNNIEKNPSLIYLSMSWLIQPLAIYYALIYRSKIACECTTMKVYNIYFYLMVILLAFPLIVYYFLPNYLINLYILTHSMEYINYAIYLMMAAIIMNLRFSSNEAFFGKLAIGLLILGLSGILYINPSSIPAGGILAHSLQAAGLFFILIGLPDIQSAAASFRIKDELVAYLSLILIMFYVVVVAMVSSIFHVIFPQSSGYIFIEILLIFQLIIYAFSNESWNKVASVYINAERDRAMIRILESMRRGASSAIIKNTIVEEIIKDLDVDKCFIVLFDKQGKSLHFDRYIESLPSKTLASFDDLDEDENMFNELMEACKNIEINSYKVKDYIINHELKGSPTEQILNKYNLKSLYTVPIDFNKKILGYLILHFTKGYKELRPDDISYLNKMAAQIGITLSKK